MTSKPPSLPFLSTYLASHLHTKRKKREKTFLTGSLLPGELIQWKLLHKPETQIGRWREEAWLRDGPERHPIPPFSKGRTLILARPLGSIARDMGLTQTQKKTKPKTIPILDHKPNTEPVLVERKKGAALSLAHFPFSLSPLLHVMFRPRWLRNPHRTRMSVWRPCHTTTIGWPIVDVFNHESAVGNKEMDDLMPTHDGGNYICEGALV